MKYILYLWIILWVFPFCNKDFEVVEATKQKWVGGTPDAGKGTNYQITMLALTGHEKLKIDKLWVGDDFYQVQAFRRDQNTWDTLFVKKDTIFIKAGKLIQPDRQGRMIEMKAYDDLPKPYNYKGEALIGYLHKGKRKYKEIAKLKERKFIAYP